MKRLVADRRVKRTTKAEKALARKSFCGECLLEITGHWLATVHKEDGTPICRARPAPNVNPFQGGYIEFAIDEETRDAIEASGLDPRDYENWVHHPAADGNKPYKRWRGRK